MLIDAALAGTTTSDSRQEAREVLSNAGYQVVDSNDVSSPLTFGAARHVLNRFASGRQTSAEILAQAINAYAAYVRIPIGLFEVLTVVNHTVSVLLSLLFVLWLRVVEGRFASRLLLGLLMHLSRQI